MKRSVVQHGPSSLIVSLPSEWVKRNKLKKGDDVEVEDIHNVLHISSKVLHTHESTSIDISTLDRTSILVLIQALYKRGFDEITLTFSRPTVIHYRQEKQIATVQIIQEALSRIVGMEVMRQSATMVQIRQISEDSEPNLDNIFSRVIHLIIDAYQTLKEEIKSNNSTNTLESHRKSALRFKNYCIRAINKGAGSTLCESTTMVMMLELIDQLMRIAFKIDKERIDKKLHFSKTDIRLFEEVSTSLELFQKFYQTGDFTLMAAIEQNRDKIKKHVDTAESSKNTAVLEFARQVPKTIQGLIDCVVLLKAKSQTTD